ncbi:RNA helicase mov10l1 [Plakobranchus ocellatus]|uniref:RNA helicase n=1 Tax=Plakobranchus ocellatus TaxID=259542 RepID=A0AAV4A6Q8_9GAST|nr:RNA helicase mov10l1 [Plakobranchus ocellatus]
MFTLLSKAVDFLVDYSFAKRNPSEDERFSESASINSETAPFLVQSNTKSQAFQGEVTHLFHGHGLINNEIYFSLSDINGNNTVQVGDKVDIKAVQHHEHGGWHAEQINVLEKAWEQEIDNTNEIDLAELQNTAILGKVTHFHNRCGKIDSEVEFGLDDCTDGFAPAPGDWVAASVEEHEQDMSADYENDPWSFQGPVKVKRARNVCPARRREIEGEVSAVLKDHGFINGEVFFRFSACLNGYSPRKKDYVKATLVESSQAKSGWRAISVYPLSSGSDAYRSKQFQQPVQKGSNAFLVPGQRPKFFKKTLILPVKLPHFDVPDYLESCVMDGRELTEVVPLLMQVLDAPIYSRRMSILLHLEEIQMQMDIKQFALTRVCLRHVGEFLALTVPGLAEGRPSVLIGDKIILYNPSDPDGPSYEGFVHEMTCTDVHLKFNPNFHGSYAGEDYNVEFTFNRSPLRKCHQAVSLAVQYLGRKVLFPKDLELKSPQIKLTDVMPFEEDIERCRFSKQDVRSKTVPSYIPPSSGPRTSCQKGWNFFNSKLNQRQKAAVMNILIGQARPVPYVIFGPPGTGKTITVVEAILQVFKRVPSSRIVACTPSNSAADLIAERLHLSGHVGQTDMVRLNAFQRPTDSLPESILKYCRFASDLEAISHYRIIVATCVMAGSMYGLGLSAGHLTHVFVDECGQATEPECLIPLGLVSGADGQIVLAGDPKQLGPIVFSPFAKMYGLELSLLERLMSGDLYQRDEEKFGDHGGFNPALVTMLVNNYRSHPAILELPSRLFYYNQLQPHADPALTHTLASWPLLPAAGFPVVFHGVRGEDMREANSPSWFNPGETMQVMCYLQGALKEGVQPEDIGIITPYRKQVEKIRLMMERLNMPDVKVGSVEEFQGQERQVIIISTVRSNEKLVGFDVRHTLGFLSNPKRFNVAITRAQALLILLGNPHVLSQDPQWRVLIQHCADNGGYTGCELPDFSKYQEDDVTYMSQSSEKNLPQTTVETSKTEVRFF